MLNNGTSKWIAIIVSIIIAAISLSVGVVRTSQEDKIMSVKRLAESNAEKIQHLLSTNASTATEIKYIRREMDEINKKLDIIIGNQMEKKGGN